MKRALILLLSYLCMSLLFVGCYSSAPSNSHTSGVVNRAFVSQDVGGGSFPAGVDIVDVQTDLLSLSHTITAGSTPQKMIVTPNRNQTLVFSPADLTFVEINNAAETDARHIPLPGATQSFVVSPDSTTAYIAIPTAPVVGQQPGAVDVVNLAAGTFIGQVSCFGNPCLPQNHAYTYLSMSNTGVRVLAFSADSDSVFVITPNNIGTATTPVVEVPGFNRPVQAFFSSDDNTAYIVNCGVSCGGTSGNGGTIASSVQTLDLTQNIPGVPVNIPAAEDAALVGTTLYLAGTPVPASSCAPQQTQATNCGLVTVFDLPSMSVTNTSPIVITDGYHDHIAMGSNGQLFIGAHDCTEILPSGSSTETRGCLSIFNTVTGAVVIPPVSGDVTGVQPIANRHVVYLVQRNIATGTPVGELYIYDTSTDKLQKTQVDISGDAYDVVTVDF